MRIPRFYYSGKQLFLVTSIIYIVSNVLTIGLFGATLVSATQSSISLSISNSTLSVDIMPSSDGIFATSDNATISAHTNNFTGYTLRILAAESTNLISGENTIASLSDNAPANNFASSSEYNGKWGYKPSQYVTSDGNAYTTHDNTGAEQGSDIYYLPSPNTTTGDILAVTSSANNTDSNNGNAPISDEYSIAIGARIGSETPPGAYRNTFNIIATSNPIVYSIGFSDNTNDSTVAGLPTGTGSVSTSDIDIALPTAVPTRTGYTFAGWCKVETTNNGTTCSSNTPYPASTPKSPSYYEIDQTADNTDMTFYATWTPIDYIITLNAGSGISTLTLNGWTNTGTSTMTKTFHIGDTIDLSTVTPTYKTSYSGAKYTNDGSFGSLNNNTFTVGAGDGNITINATTLATPTCSIQGGATKAYNYSATTLTATNNSSDYDTSSTDITYSFGFASNGTNDLGSFTAASSTNTLSVTKAAFRGTRYYGVTVVVTDKTDSSITATCTSGTVDAATTGTTVANRTTMTLVNSRIDFNANGGTLSGTSPIYVSYQNSASYSSGTGSTARAIPSVTPAEGYTFLGWYTTATGGTKIVNADGTIVSSVSGWTDSSGRWIRTTTASSASTSNTLYAHYTNTYTITVNAGSGINTLALSGWTGTGTGTMTKTYQYGSTINLSTINTTYKTAYSGKAYAKADSVGTLSGSTYTVGAGDGNITINATTLAAPTCSILGGTTKVYNRSATTLTATNNSSNYDTNSTDITYSFGYALGSSTVDGSTANLGNFSAAQASNTYTVAKNAFRSAYGRFYGVTVTATDKNDSSITATCTSGTGYGTTAAANRTRLILVNSRIDFDANGGTLSGTSPIYVIYQSNASYSSRTGSTARAIPSATPSGDGITFDGWYTASSGGTKVVNADGTIVSSVSGWTDSSGRWIRTSTTSSASASNTLYAHYICGSNKICYNANGSNVEGTMGQKFASASSSVTLLASNFSRSGYGFAGWNTKPDYTGTFYGPNETITTPSDMSAGLILYAIWVQSAGSLQDSTKVAQLCGTGSGSLTQAPTNGTANLSSVSALTDQRDNQTYAIAKLADGNCWMIENMRLDNTATGNSTGSLSQGYNSSFAGLADPEEPSLFANVTTANSLYSTDGSTEKTISGNYPAYRFPRYNNQNIASRADTITTNNNNVYSYGNYYTWAAAIADTTYYSTDNQSVTNTSICPSGWHLPKGGNNQNTANNEFLAFSEALIGTKPANYDSQTYPGYTDTPEGSDASNKLRSYPNNFLYSGIDYISSVDNRGSNGYYWSSTANSGSYAYYLILHSTYIGPGTINGHKYSGRTIRCLSSS